MLVTDARRGADLLERKIKEKREAVGWGKYGVDGGIVE